MMKQYYKHELNVKEEDIPEPFHLVEAEIVRSPASLAVRKRLAGEHQARQQNSHQGTVADVLGAFMRTSKEKLEKLQIANLTDNEVWQVIAQIGLQHQSAFELSKQRKPSDTEQQLQQRQV